MTRAKSGGVVQDGCSWRAVSIDDLKAQAKSAIAIGPFGSRMKSDVYVEQGVPVIRGKNISTGRQFVGELVFVSDETADELKSSNVFPDDLVFPHRGAIGEVGIVPRSGPDRWMLSTSLMKLSVDRTKVDPLFLFYFFRSPVGRGELLKRSSNVGTPGIAQPLTSLRSITLALPPLGTQQAITQVLVAIDDLIENNRRRVDALEKTAQAIYREWFVHFRYPGHEDVPLVDSPLGPIPHGWTTNHLQSVAKVNNRSRTPTEDEVIRYLDISALGERSVGPLSELVGGEAPGRARRVVEPGDVVWSMVRPNRRAHALLVDPGPEWIASTGLAVLSATGVSSTWLFEATSTREFSDYLVSQEGGAAYPAVKPKDFERAPVVVPRSDVDQLFAERVSPVHRLCWSLREQSDALASLRDLLLPKLVTGQVDVSDLDLDALTGAAVT